MTDLINLMASLVDNKGKILIPGINDSVAALHDEEAKLYESIDFDMVSGWNLTRTYFSGIKWKWLSDIRKW